MKFEGPKQEANNLDRSTEKHSFELWDKCFEEAEAGNFAPAIKKNEKGEILAPNGMVSRLPNEDFVKVTRTPTFKKWFGDWVNDPKNSSKVVYEDTGEPMVVYHGTIEDISVEEGLQPNKSKTRRQNSLSRQSVYFTPNFELAKYWKSRDNEVLSCFLNIKTITVLNNHLLHQLYLYVVSKFKIKKDGFSYNNKDHRVFYGVHDHKNIMHLPSDIT